eukprot:Plantae.Rhodophyta-Purpureofilum_apyrenoidigerum.ctg20888.p1 GENE.Plantae.Rhodophyta-Purpureofilum_apyrenoidigerum.ctg20888~~Plantae.Rhodophyta-Purpureofilum_apyrenoidigerum.ctg20888.p1  ORF type:complete len:542 (-),score=52.02 Plantae.Rhodophyta-Purpureofilum_apyrenoidigerum.ctg20888:131-1756(-)
MAEVEQCNVLLECSHKCHGFKGETKHLPCLVKGCENGSKYQNGSDDCAICLCELEDEPCIELACGHIWHLTCLKEQLRVAQPNPTRRLMFTGCACGQCGQFCEHDALDGVMRSANALKGKVEALVLEQAKVDNLVEAPSVKDSEGAYHGKLMDYGLHIYAFYLCSVCEEPFFGGTVACADDNGEIPKGDRICDKCNPRTASVCTNTSHRGHYIWKCRYCCSEAKYVCYGNVHFCKECHERNSQRERKEKLKARPCPGLNVCRLPMPTGKERHENGAEIDNEQLLRCAWCESDPQGRTASSTVQRGSPNMLFNPDGARRNQGWEQSSMPWQTEQSIVPIFDTRTNFVSSFRWCEGVQCIELKRFAPSPETLRIEVSARYMGRTDCPSVFIMKSCLLDREGRQLELFESGTLEAPADFWEEVQHVFDATPNAYYLVFLIRGKDSRFWNGNYGSKVTRCSARFLFDDNVQDEGAVVYRDSFGGETFQELGEEARRALVRCPLLTGYGSRSGSQTPRRMYVAAGTNRHSRIRSPRGRNNDGCNMC